MEKITMQAPVESTQETPESGEKEIRLLQDLEMVLVGGGSDAIVLW